MIISPYYEKATSYRRQLNIARYLDMDTGLLITTLLFLILHFFSVRLVNIFMDYLMAKDQKTPLGWTYKYRFLDIFILNVFLLLAFEMVCYIRLLRKK